MTPAEACRLRTALIACTDLSVEAAYLVEEPSAYWSSSAVGLHRSRPLLPGSLTWHARPSWTPVASLWSDGFAPP